MTIQFLLFLADAFLFFVILGLLGKEELEKRINSVLNFLSCFAIFILGVLLVFFRERLFRAMFENQTILFLVVFGIILIGFPWAIGHIGFYVGKILRSNQIKL